MYNGPMGIRLNKYIAQAGIASRRKADELTLAGQVKINGAVMRTPGYEVQDGDVVSVSGRVIGQSEALVYYALNKPAGFVTTTSDDQGRPTVLDLLTDVTARVYPVGRLDLMTSGLLLLTNDGALAQKLTHPSQEVWKTYRALVGGTVTQEELRQLRAGVRIEGGYRTAPAKAELIRETAGKSLVEVQIHEGKNRQVRKMFEAVGHRVLALERIAVGEIRLGRLKEGTYRRLTAKELQYLRGL